MTMTADGIRSVPQPVAAIRQQQRREWTTLVEQIALLRATDDTNALAMGDLFVEVTEIAGGKQHLRLAAEQAGVEWVKASQRYRVSRRIPQGHRLRTIAQESGLTFTHLRDLCGLANDADMIAWAERAVAGQWSTQRLRDEIDASSDVKAKEKGVACHDCGTALNPEDVIVTLRVERSKQLRCCSHACAIRHLQKDAQTRQILLPEDCRQPEGSVSASIPDTHTDWDEDPFG